VSDAREAVAVRDLTLAFEAGKTVLDRVSVTVGTGEFVSLVGPSGCGKTTLLNLMAGLVDTPASGSIEVLGAAPKLGHEGIAYQLARDSLLPWRDALGNASYGMQVRGVARPEREARARAMLGKVGLAGYEHALPKMLSHGMRQRVALARTFALGAPLLLMDEPFGALDAQTKLSLEDQLLQLCQEEKHSVVFVTHDLAEAVALSDRVIVMSARPGRIVADVPIDLPRPRSVRALQKDPAFHELYSKVWTHLESGWGGNNLDEVAHG
jgi:NitT/TauT family transport system ATP-binding protein